MHWAAKYVGRPWQAAAPGPDAFDCWSFVRWVSLADFGRELPEMAIDPDDLRACLRAFRDECDSRWQPVSEPIDGDVVLLRSGRYASHCGIFVKDLVGGAVAHCERGCGVVVAPRRRLPALGYQHQSFYRWRD